MRINADQTSNALNLIRENPRNICVIRERF
jgi:hypothetical protein